MRKINNITFGLFNARGIYFWRNIKDMVVERVAEKIAKKKALAAMTPKVSEIAAMDKDNIAYFEEMIDKAIAKKSGK